MGEGQVSTFDFEAAALAVVDGATGRLRALLEAQPALVRARSQDGFGATLLHYVAANGVPDELQRTPPNAVEIAQLLLDAGSEPDATGSAYGGGPDATPLCLLVSSWHPFARGVQADLVRCLVQGGAKIDGARGDGAPMATALVFGYTRAAETLRDLGARVDNVLFAAGLGDLALTRAMLLSGAPYGSYRPPVAKEMIAEEYIQEAFHFAVTHGRIEVAQLLIDHRAEVNRPLRGHHAELPLLQALFVRELETARWLLAKGADPDLVDAKLGRSARQDPAFKQLERSE